MKQSRLKSFALAALSVIFALTLCFGVAGLSNTAIVKAGSSLEDLNFEHPTSVPSAYVKSTSNPPSIKTQNSISCIIISDGGSSTAPTITDDGVTGGKRWLAFSPAVNCDVTITVMSNKKVFTLYDKNGAVVTYTNTANKEEDLKVTGLKANAWYAMCGGSSQVYVTKMAFVSTTTTITGVQGYTYNETASRYEAAENAMTGTEAATLKAQLPATVTATYGENGTQSVSVTWDDGVVSGSTITFTGTMTAPDGYTLQSATLVKTYTLTDEKTAVGTFTAGAVTVMVGTESIELPTSITDSNGVSFNAAWSGSYDLGVVGVYTLTAVVNAEDYPVYDFTSAVMPEYVVTVAPKTVEPEDDIIITLDCDDDEFSTLPRSVKGNVYYGEEALNEQATLSADWDADSYDEVLGTIDGTLTAPAGYAFLVDGEYVSSIEITAGVKLVHAFDDDENTSVCSKCGEYIRYAGQEEFDFDAGMNIANGDLATDYQLPEGWSFVDNGADTKAGDDSEIYYAADTESLNRVYPIALGNKNALGAVTYEFEQAMTMVSVTVDAGACSGNAATSVKVTLYDASGDVIATETKTVPTGKKLAEYVFTFNAEGVYTVEVANGSTGAKLFVERVVLDYYVISEAEYVTLTFDVNGGDALAEDEVVLAKGQNYTLPTPTRATDADGTAYNFQYWEDDNYSTYNAGEDVFADDDLTFTAVWAEAKMGTEVTGAFVSAITYVQKGSAPEIPTTATIYYGEESNYHVDVPVTLHEGVTYDYNVSGAYEITLDLDNMGGLYDLGDYATLTYTLYVFEYKVYEVPDIYLSVKLNGAIAQTTVKVVYRAYVGSTVCNDETFEDEFEVEWAAFDSSAVGTYQVTGTLTAKDGIALGDFATVTANVEVYDFEAAGISTVYVNSQTTYDALSEYGFTVSDSVSFDNGGTDAYLGAKLAGGGKITFTLEKATHVIIGVSSDKATAYLDFYKEGDVTPGEGDAPATQNYLKQITSFTDNKYQTIDMTLEAGTYVLENAASGSSNNFSLTYVVVDDGGQQTFIPTAGNNTVVANTDKLGFIGWYAGDTVYTVGATMPVAANNKGVVEYKAVYNVLPDMAAKHSDMLALGWLVDGVTYEKQFDATVGAEWVAMFAKVEWVNGAALRITGASADTATDNSALKFRVYITLAGDYAANLVNRSILTDLADIAIDGSEGDLATTSVINVSKANEIEYNVYIEKVASKGYLNTVLAAGISLNGVEYEYANRTKAAYIAQRAMEDYEATADDTHKFIMADGNYSYFNDEERAELQKYLTLAETQEDKAENADVTPGEDGGEGEGQPEQTGEEPKQGIGEVKTEGDEDGDGDGWTQPIL